MLGNTIQYRMAEEKDAELVYEFVRKLAVYEKLEHEVVANLDDISVSLFGDAPHAFCVLAEIDGKAFGFCLCYYNYSTFQGRPGIYIEDLYVLPEYRGQGAGRGFFQFLAEKAKREDCRRIEWSVLDWNEPSIKFYKAMGAKPMDEWTVNRLDGKELNALAAGGKA